jgi:hypothetical protein
VAVVEASGERWIFSPRNLLGRAHGWHKDGGSVRVCDETGGVCVCVRTHVMLYAHNASPHTRSDPRSSLRGGGGGLSVWGVGGCLSVCFYASVFLCIYVRMKACARTHTHELHQLSTHPRTHVRTQDARHATRTHTHTHKMGIHG